MTAPENVTESARAPCLVQVLFESLPTLRRIEAQPAHSPALRDSSLSVIASWLNDKLSQSKWVQMVQDIRQMAEGPCLCFLPAALLRLCTWPLCLPVT